MKNGFFIDNIGASYKYVLYYLHYGWNEERFSNNLKELDELAKEMQIENSAKPLIIVNGDNEVIRIYSERKRGNCIGEHNKLDIFTLEDME